MFKRTATFIILLLLVLAGPGFIKYQQIQQSGAKMAAGTPPPTSVEVVTAQQIQWQPRMKN